MANRAVLRLSGLIEVLQPSKGGHKAMRGFYLDLIMFHRVSAFRLHEVLISFVHGFGDVSRSATMLSAF